MNAGASPDTAVRVRPPAVPAAGLTSAEAVSRLARDGGNVLPAPRPVPLWRRAAAQARNRALKALGCAQQDIGPKTVKLQGCGGAG